MKTRKLQLDHGYWLVDADTLVTCQTVLTDKMKARGMTSTMLLEQARSKNPDLFEGKQFLCSEIVTDSPGILKDCFVQRFYYSADAEWNDNPNAEGGEDKCSMT